MEEKEEEEEKEEVEGGVSCNAKPPILRTVKMPMLMLMTTLCVCAMVFTILRLV
jgi:hypothetical protein